MTTIGLDRRFLRWDEKDAAAADNYAMLGRAHNSHDWPKLLEQRRVVMLAEAGSGKTEELCEQARLLTANDQFAFYATVQDVAREGLDSALNNAGRARLDAWRQSGRPGWFFVDSIDEAKLDNIRLETALRKLADAIEAAPRRAHIVLSGRLTDWQYRADLERVTEGLPVPPERTALSLPTPDTILVQALRGELRRKPDDTSEAPLVVLMAPLDAERIRRFATAKGVSALDPFMAALEDANLWSLARRPLDLDWMIAYWRRHGRFGRLAEMLEASLIERLREPNPLHAQNDPIDFEHASRALERIGAALVFGRADKLSIPDPEIMATPSIDFDLAQVLPDWSAEHRRRLLTRAVFDPATFGRVRLHNDSLAEVRSYLAARWLVRRRQENCSVRDLLDLLFAESYGLSLIKPSVRQTASWLAIWDGDVAREILAREPLLMMTEGDPASLMLATRHAALQRVVEEMLARGERFVHFDQDSLRRFSTPDMVPQIHALWTAHKSHQGIRGLLLRMIWLGRLNDCADLAAEALFGDYTDRHTLVFAGRALSATGDAVILARYADKIQGDAGSLPGVVLWEALDQLFPKSLSVDDFLVILEAMSSDTRDESLGLQYYGPRLAERVGARADLERLLGGLLGQLGAAEQDFTQGETPLEKAYYPVVTSTAQFLLQATGGQEAPPLAIDAALRLGEGRRYRRSDQAGREFTAELRNSPERRQAAFWRAAARFAGHRMLQGQGLQHAWQLDMVGWSPGLMLADVGWLLTDLATRANEAERRLAGSAVMELWNQNGRDTGLLARIQLVTAGQPTLAQVCDLWLTPREPSAEELAHKEQMAGMQLERQAEEAERDRSWREFLDTLRADPDALRRQPPPTRDNVDGRLYYLWELLRSVDEQRTHFAIDDIRPIAPILGAELTAAFRDALVGFWRQWSPTLPSMRPPDKRNVVSNIDGIAIAGISIEAKDTLNWPAGLNPADANKAAAYAVLEINGFPVWFEKLAIGYPAEVQAVLTGEIRAEIDNAAPGPRYGTLEDVVHAPSAIAGCVAPALFDLLVARDEFPKGSLSSALTVIARGLVERRGEFAALALARFAGAMDLDSAGLYLSVAFKISPAEALAALIAKFDALNAADQTLLVQHALPGLFGDMIFERDAEPPALPFDVLERLVQIAFRTIRVDDDNRHDTGQAYSPDSRDAAQNARSALFNQLCMTPGRATFDCLGRFGKQMGFPVPPERLRDLAFTRAATDAEHSPWQPGEVRALEQEFDAAPNTPADLQAVALRRLSDLQHALHHGDFAQGRTLKGLQGERAVQNWVADQLRSKQGRAYSVEREPHVVEEKEPDIRLRSRTTDSSLPLEIKIAESWTLLQLEAALTDQLGGRYLRAQDARHGVLILVHQKARDRGWKVTPGRYLTFPEVVTHLQTIADVAAAVAPDAPQARIAVLNVSDV